jgi:hypothetical protein
MFSGGGYAARRWDNRRCSPTFHDLHSLSHRHCLHRTMQLQELAWTRTPFAIKGGGHSLNPGFSSTSGIHISLRRMNDIVVHEDSKTVEIGAGLNWIDVYTFLVPKGINVLGGRLAKIGVAGFMLGGGDYLLSKVHGMHRLKEAAGYCWKTSQYGLGVDNVMEYELVLPSGEVKLVTEKDQDLWFALKVRRLIQWLRGYSNELMRTRVDLTTM